MNIVYTMYIHGMYMYLKVYTIIITMYVRVCIMYVDLPLDSFHESSVVAYHMDNWHT